jgi:hypothetical protein
VLVGEPQTSARAAVIWSFRRRAAARQRLIGFRMGGEHQSHEIGEAAHQLAAGVVGRHHLKMPRARRRR